MIEPTFHKKLSDFIYIPSYWHTLLSTLDGIFLAKLYIDNKDDNVHKSQLLEIWTKADFKHGKLTQSA